ncbi:MAG: aldo/keto reductase [Treponema sp.]|nr:aldo/keto reductase [Treponema sp.]
MQYIKFGNIHEKISRLGLGCMRLPQIETEDGKKDFDDDAGIELIRTAIDKGINYIDTAWMYGRSEIVVGKALQDGYRSKVILATKIWFSDKTTCKADLEAALQDQLSRLQTDYIDVFLLHNMHQGNWKRALQCDALNFLRESKEKGLIRHCACSIHERYDHLITVLDAFPWEMVMVQYNYLDKNNQVGQKGVREIHARGIPVIAMEPLHGGLLAQDVPQDVVDAFGDFHPDKNQAAKAFMWLYNQPEISVILSGSSTVEQVLDSIKIFEHADYNVLKEADEEVYEKVREVWSKKARISCTNCKYCLPCPAGVNIPEIFRMLNETARDAQRSQRWLYSAILMAAGEGATKCTKCKLCEPKCPQFIPIAEKLEEAHEILTYKKD